MDRVEQFIQDTLAHADQYYDPVKAHEYYEQHKKLKGRRMAKKGETPPKDPPSRREKIARAANKATKQLGPKKDAAVTAASNAAKSKLSALTKDLSSWAEKLSKEAQAKHAKIEADTNKKIAAVPAIPKGVVGSKRTKLETERKQQIAKIKADGATQQKNVDANIKSKFVAKKAEVKSQRDKILAEAKDSIKKIVATKPASGSSGKKTAPPRR